MIFRKATIVDIPQLQIIRNSVVENILSDPNLISLADYIEFLTQRGNGWLCDLDGTIVGFAIVDLIENNVWALFVKPGFEKQGIGKELHNTMLNWYFSNTKTPIWLGTAPNTRAETFYRKLGWETIGIHGKGEVKFEMTYQNWSVNLKSNKSHKA